MAKEESTLEQFYHGSIKNVKEGQVIKGKIILIKPKEAFVDVGFKSEGAISINEFAHEELEIGKELDFLVEQVEDDSGTIVLSREKARRMHGWDKVVKDFQQGDLIEGRVRKKVKGGFMIDVQGIEGFLPASLSGFKGVPDKDTINNAFKFKIVKLNNIRRSLILSRKEAMQKEKEESKEKLFSNLEPGRIVTGSVKAITDFGAFIDLGGIDGLLHITDMSWSKITHPSEVVALGDKIDVVVLNFDREQSKVSLGLKQRLPDPWLEIEKKYPISAKVKGKVVNITNYGIFVELEKGIEGLVHISEISWAKRVSNLQDIFAVGDTIEVQILSISKETRRIALSVKQLEANPWLDVESKYPVETKVSGRVRGFTDYGVFVELDANLEGMIHVSDMSWTKRIAHPQDILKKGQKVDAVVISVDSQNRRIALGLKQLQPNPWPEIAVKYPLETVVETEIVSITEFGVFVKIEEDLEGLVFANEIDKDKLPELKVGDKIKVKVIKVDVEQAKIGLSAKV
jgi:small subunit ribosomal protein S1